MLHICATYDYELFLGRMYATEEEVLIVPTNHLLDIYEENGVKLTLFADTCCINRYREERIIEFPQSAEFQLKQTIKRGHDVQLHIHPHWLSAHYESNQWIYDNNYYRLHAYDNLRIAKIVEDNVKYLNDLLCQVNKGYRCVAFRAGGYCIQPELDIVKVLYKNGIRIDSSVCIGNSNYKNPHMFDFTDVIANYNWDFGIDKGLNHRAVENEHFMMEIPIFGISNIIEKIAFKYLCKIVEVNSLKGEPVNSKEEIRMNFWNKLKEYRHTSYILQFDRYDYKTMLYMLGRVVTDRMIETGEYYIAIVGHPKVQEKELIVNTDRFIKAVKRKYGDLVVFDTLQNVADERKLI